MGVTIQEYEWLGPTSVEDYVRDYLAHETRLRACLSRDDDGVIEAMGRDIRAHHAVVSRLFQHLADKGLLTAGEVESIVRGF